MPTDTTLNSNEATRGEMERMKSMSANLVRRCAGVTAGLLAGLLPSRLMRDKRLFPIWQKHGFHVTPVHFYEPIPDTAALSDNVWRDPSSMIGIDMRESHQVQLLDDLSSRYRKEYGEFPRKGPHAQMPFWIENGMLVSVDAEVLYSLVRRYRPRRIIEIGCGFSTILASLAIDKNKAEDPSYECELIGVEPYPRRDVLASCHNLSRLIDRPVQGVPMSEFLQLGQSDILFVDSSHVSKIGSDVNHNILEIIPRLNPGVLVHLHDIFLPFEYPKRWVQDLNIFWNEQYLLQAFLSFNSAYEIIWAGSWMHWKHPDRLASAFGSYDPLSTLPGSLWIQRK